MLYLLKVTLTWSVLLLLFEIFFKNSGRYVINRLYLTGSMILGLLLPLLQLPHGFMINTVTQSAAVKWVTGTATAIQPAPAAESTAISWSFVLTCVYLTGAAVLLLISLREIGIIIHHAIYSRYETINKHKVFSTEKVIAPYSFMGWIFISKQSEYDEHELNFVLDHEEAHNRQKHWADLLLMQAICILCWFHPLVWRYRYLLRLQHEYEADAIASGDDAYTYGHFLLQQTLLKGTPFVAHSFHFSPIKNRINMLTRKQNADISGWKYLMIVPALLTCTLLMAKSDRQSTARIRSGNKTTFNGNSFYWTKETAPDTVTVLDVVSNQETVMLTAKDPVIEKMNNEPVTESTSVPAQFRNGNKNFSEYLKDRLNERGIQIPESIRQISVNKIVINKTGRLVYYELTFLETGLNEKGTIKDYDNKLTPVLEEIIADSPDWMPASANGKPVNVFIAYDPSCAIMSKAVSRDGK